MLRRIEVRHSNEGDGVVRPWLPLLTLAVGGFNLVLAIVILSLSIWTLADGGDGMRDLLNSSKDEVVLSAQIGPIILLVTSVLTGFTAAAAAYFVATGVVARGESGSMVNTTLAALVLMMMLYASGACVVGLGDLEEDVESALMSTLSSYGADSAATDAWDAAIEGGECCGVDGFQDWQENNGLFDGEQDGQAAPLVPDSCCKYVVDDDSDTHELAACTLTPEDYPELSQGCLDVAMDWIGPKQEALCWTSVTEIFVVATNAILVAMIRRAAILAQE